MASKPHPPQTVIVLALGLGQTIAFASSFYLLGVLGDDIAADLVLAPTFVFSLMSVALAASAVAAPAVGRWVDRRGGKAVLLISNLVFAAGLGLVGLAHGAVVLTLGMVVLGLAMALGLYGTPFAILVALYGDRARRAITGVALIGGLGSSLGFPATHGLAQQFGWQGACFAWAGLHLLVWLPLGAVLIPRHVAGHMSADVGAPTPVVWDRRMIQLSVLFAGAWFLSTCMSTHLPRLFVAFGLSTTVAMSTAALVGFAAVAVRALEFAVLRRFPPLMATRAATLMHPLGATALLVFGRAGAPAMALGQGAGNGMLTVAKGVLPLSIWGSGSYAYRSALLGRPAQIAQIGGPALYGLALDRSPTLALLGGAALCLVMFAMTFGLNQEPVT
ncbi:MFS transporter [Phenylobacterium sp.]|uniref:MFS transporter n=1 Tax=Phenylobacterium sp. TaxID=1871053 RepID=UPI003BAD9246